MAPPILAEFPKKLVLVDESTPLEIETAPPDWSAILERKRDELIEKLVFATPRKDNPAPYVALLA
jgi:hypothetical protein